MLSVKDSVRVVVGRVLSGVLDFGATLGKIWWNDLSRVYSLVLCVLGSKVVDPTNGLVLSWMGSYLSTLEG